ncbi:MAG TPA: hypothetical protein VKZ53_26685 [Candidatus Angelobacter sp.]|nr:hypothetical protein [Candidatus Angelobacter sp.]
MLEKNVRKAAICCLILTLVSPSLIRNTARATATTAPDFTLALSQSGLVQLKEDHGFILDATITALNGFNGTVTVTVSGLPPGVTVLLSDSNSTVTGSGTAELEIHSNMAEAKLGVITNVVVTATSGSLSHTAGFQMKVIGG